MTKRDPSIKTARRALRVAHFTNDLYAAFMPTVMPIFIREFGLSLAQAGFFSSFLALMSSFLQPIFGILTDKTYTRAYVILGPIITAIFISATGLITDIWQLLPLLFIASIGTAAFHPQGAALAGTLAKKDTHSPSIAKFIVAGTLGASCSSYLAFVLLGPENNIRNLIFAAPFGVLGGLMLWFTIPKIQVENKIKKFRARLWKIRANSLTLLVLTVVLRSTVVGSFIAFLPEFFYQSSLADESINDNIHNLILASGNPKLFLGALSILIFHLAIAIGSIIGSYIDKKVGHANLFIYSFLISMPLIWFFVETKSFVILIIMGIIVNLTQSVNISLTQMLIPQNAATVSSFAMGFGWGTATLMMPVIGHFADSYGLGSALKYNALIFLLCATLVIFFLKKDRSFQRITS